MTIARVTAIAVIAGLAMQPGFAVAKPVIPITKPKPAPIARVTPHLTTTQSLRTRTTQTGNGHH
jgi:hypothetical protein